MTERELEETRLREYTAILDSVRAECASLVDDYFVAFWNSHRPLDEWKLISEYEHMLFRAARDAKMTIEERRGAYKLIRAYLESVIETLTLEKMIEPNGVIHAKN